MKIPLPTQSVTHAALVLACAALTISCASLFQTRAHPNPAQFDRAVIDQIVHLNALKAWQQEKAAFDAQHPNPFEKGALTAPPAVNLDQLRQSVQAATQTVAERHHVLLIEKHAVAGVALVDYTDEVLAELGFTREDAQTLSQSVRRQVFGFPKP